jgi:hypothetical protein
MKAPAFFTVLSAVIYLSSTSAQNLLKNGDFENPIIPSSARWATYKAGERLSDWLVNQGDVDLISQTYTALALTSQALDLNGSVPGAIQQEIATEPGKEYELSWRFKLNHLIAADARYRVQVIWNGDTIADLIRPFTKSSTFERVFVHVRGSGHDNLSFRSLTGDTGGFLLDDITLVKITIPDPVTNIVTDLTEDTLRSAIAGGGVTHIAVSGTISLSKPLIVRSDTTLDGTGFDVTISGNNVTRMFEVRSNVNLAIKDLNLRAGRFASQTSGASFGGAWGGAILNDQGFVSATRCTFITNSVIGGNEYSATGLSSNTCGGAIFSRKGGVALTNCAFSLNLAESTGSDVTGGAIGIIDGFLVVDGCQFWTNKIGTTASTGGGAIALSNSTAKILRSEFRGNGGWNGGLRPGWSKGGEYAGGAIRAIGGDLVISNSSFIENAARSADGLPGPGPARGAQANGGALFLADGTARISQCYFKRNVAVAGKAIRLVNDGQANDYFGGDAKGGAISVSSNTLIENSTFDSNAAIAGIGGDHFIWQDGFCYGGTSFGGDIYNEGSLSVQNSTFYRSSATGGGASGARGRLGDAKGGAIFNTNGIVSVSHITTSETIARPGVPETTFVQAGSANGAAVHTTNGIFSLLHSIISFGRGSGNIFGAISDKGGNLSSDNSIAFTDSSSRAVVNPRLSAFGFYGSTVPTFSLQPQSPGRDIVTNSTCLQTDQRGRPRPYGAGCDSGASENQPPYFISGSLQNAPASAKVTIGSTTVDVGADCIFEFSNLQAGLLRASAEAPGVVFVPLDFNLELESDIGDLEFRAYPRNVLSFERVNGAGLYLIFGGTGHQFAEIEKSDNLVMWVSAATVQLDASGGLWSQIATNETTSFFRLKFQ